MLRKIKISFSDEEVYQIPVAPDGSCFFHCLCLATNTKEYMENEKERREMVISLRKLLAEKLDKIRYEDKIWYDTLSRGKLKSLSSDVGELSLESMKNELLSMGPVDEKFFEYVSDILNIDMYIINADTKKIINLEKEIYYKNRKSVVLYFYPAGHYDLLITRRNEEDQDRYYFIFENNDRFILSMKELII
jgi:hypothetical protein